MFLLNWFYVYTNKIILSVPFFFTGGFFALSF
jgi:hypothetical protein